MSFQTGGLRLHSRRSSHIIPASSPYSRLCPPITWSSTVTTSTAVLHSSTCWVLFFKHPHYAPSSSDSNTLTINSQFGAVQVFFEPLKQIPSSALTHLTLHTTGCHPDVLLVFATVPFPALESITLSLATSFAGRLADACRAWQSSSTQLPSLRAFHFQTQLSNRMLLAALDTLIDKMPALQVLSLQGSVCPPGYNPDHSSGQIHSLNGIAIRLPNLRRLRCDFWPASEWQLEGGRAYADALIRALRPHASLNVTEHVQISDELYDDYSSPESVEDVKSRLGLVSSSRAPAGLSAPSVLITLVHQTRSEDGSYSVEYHTWLS